MFKLFAQSFSDRLLRIAIICIFLSGFASASVAPFLSIVAIERLAFSEFSFAIIQLLSAILCMIASICVGVYTDQSGHYKNALAVSIFAYILATALMYFAHAQFIFVIYMLVLMPIASTGFSQYFALSRLAANKNTSLNKDFSSSLTRAAFTLSWAITPPLIAIFIAQGMDLFSLFGIAALLGCLILFVIWSSWPNEAKPPKKEDDEIGFFKGSFFKGLKELAELPIFIRITLVSAMIATNNLFAILLGLLVINDLGGTEADVGWFAGGVALMEIPVMLLGTFFLRYVSKAILLLIASVVYGGFLFGMGLATHIDQVWLLTIPAGLSAGIILSVTIGYAQDLKPDNPGLGGSLMSVAHFASRFFTAAIFAGGAAITDYSGIAWIGGALGIIAAMLLVIVDRKPLTPSGEHDGKPA
ncbi:MAG: MFS transporter [Lentilitoribacter sp.]